MTTTPTTPALHWTSAGTDDPGDQEATSATGPRSFWSVGPAAGGTWIAELVHLDEAGAELPYGALLRCADEDAAKDAAARYEPLLPGNLTNIAV